MQELSNLFDKLYDELCECGEKDLTQDSLKTIDTLAHAAKNVLKVMEGCEGVGSYAYYDEDPRTTAMGGSMRGSYNGNGSYRGSYRMSGRRDSMGRYSRESGNGGSYEGGMSNRGYSRGGNNVVDGLKELMYAAPQEMQGEIQRLIKKLDNM